MLSNGDSNTVERLGIFARFPEPGRAKTRLIPALGPEGAARLHEEMVRHTLRMTDDLKKARAVMVEVWFAGGGAKIDSWLFSEHERVMLRRKATLATACRALSARCSLRPPRH